MSPIDKQSQVTLAEGNLKVRTSTTGGGYKVRGTIKLSGKVYFEGLIGAVGGDIGSWFGIADYNDNVTDFNTSRRNGLYYNASDFRKAVDGSFSVISSGALSADDIIGLAYNFDDNEFSIYRNNSAVLTDATFTNDVDFAPIADIYRNDSTDTGFIFNFGQDSSFAGAKTAQNNSDQNGRGDFYYSPPAGYLALCTANLPEPTISPLNGDQPADHFNTVLYSGTGSSNAITGVGFQPDMVWFKERSANTGGGNYWYQIDAIRGATKVLHSNTSGAESTGDSLSLDSDGFTLGSYSGGNANQNGETYAAWNWLGANGTTSNSDGTITSTISVNTKAGFSLMRYTGNHTAGATVGHGLGVAPKVVITKALTGTYSWIVGHNSFASDAWTDAVYLDTLDAVSDYAGYWNDTAPTSSVISLGGAYNPVNGNALNYAMVAFAEVEGYSKFGRSTGNGSTDGTFVYTGFRPAVVIAKPLTNGYNWVMYDNKRSPINPVRGILYPSGDYEENTGADRIDFLSNGYKYLETGNDNGDGLVSVFMAFAEMPFKYANAR